MKETELQIPFTLARDLPEHTGSVGDNTGVLAVLDNSRTVRVPVDSLSATWVKWWQGAPPSDKASPGSEGYVFIDYLGFYAYYDGQWGKLPVYSDNWDDLKPGTRFLRTDDRMYLDGDEVDNVRASIGLKIAGEDVPGLVCGAVGESAGPCTVRVASDGMMTVPSASSGTGLYGVVKVDDANDEYSVTSVKFVTDALRRLERFSVPVASPSVLGGIKPDGVTITVTDEGDAEVPRARPGEKTRGLVMLSPSSLEDKVELEVDDEINTAASVYLTELMIADYVATHTGAPATQTRTGAVQVPGNSAIRVITETTVDAEIPELDYMTGDKWPNGCIDVDPADANKHGAVVVLDSYTAASADDTREINGKRYYVVPTAAAVLEQLNKLKDVYVPIHGVEQGQVTISPSVLPNATYESKGVVQVASGAGLSVQGGLLAAKEAVPDTDEDKAATSAVRGTVRVWSAPEDAYGNNNNLTVPSSKRVKAMIADASLGGLDGLRMPPYETEEVYPSGSGGNAYISLSRGMYYRVQAGLVSSITFSVAEQSNGVYQSFVEWVPDDSVTDFSTDGVLVNALLDMSGGTAVERNRMYVLKVLVRGFDNTVMVSIDSAYQYASL